MLDWVTCRFFFFLFQQGLDWIYCGLFIYNELFTFISEGMSEYQSLPIVSLQLQNLQIRSGLFPKWMLNFLSFQVLNKPFHVMWFTEVPSGGFSSAFICRAPCGPQQARCHIPGSAHGTPPLTVQCRASLWHTEIEATTVQGLNLHIRKVWNVTSFITVVEVNLGKGTLC